LADHPAQAVGWRCGRARLMGLFGGAALQRSAGRADPVAATRIFTQLLRGQGKQEGVT
jgi:Asp-tRNA(Asn)/Glu-tRNA(Gln) amidotransferase B subunit